MSQSLIKAKHFLLASLFLQLEGFKRDSGEQRILLLQMAPTFLAFQPLKSHNDIKAIEEELGKALYAGLLCNSTWNQHWRQVHK